MNRTTLALVLPLLIGCGARDTVASKSARAYDEAIARGETVGGGHEHSHGAETSTDSGESHAAHEATESQVDHSQHSARPRPAAAPKPAAAPGHDQHGQHQTTPSAPATPSDGHQAHGAPTAVATPVTTGTGLRADEFDAPSPAAVAEASKQATGAGHGGHGTGADASHDAGQAAPGAHSGHGAAKTETPATSSVVYTCPMHPKVTAAQPGRCPICGMNLVKKGKGTE